MSQNAPPQRWNADDIPDLSGRVALVTGANSGLGYESVLALARRGARVVLACRDVSKARAAADAVASEVPEASLERRQLDLASLESVRSFANSFLADHASLDILLNNAGVMAIPYRKTADGFEMQLGTNHFGHFALAGLLLRPLLATPGARIVTVSSSAHQWGQMRFEDLHWKRGYRKWQAYGQSKLANLLFAYELQRRLETKGCELLSLACHPGYAATELQGAGPRMAGSSFMERAMNLSNLLFSQSAVMGALPSLYAATSPEAKGGDYIGPDGIGEVRGHPKKVESSARSKDLAAAARLWTASEDATGVRYEGLVD